MFPVLLDLTGRLVVVVGGGSVGRRKALAARDAGAVVRVIDPNPPPLPDQPAAAGGVGPSSPQGGGITWVPARYDPDHLAGVCLVFAAATPEVNARVVADAKARGIWVNAATDPERGDCFLPAVVRRGGLTVAVGTGGASPALARRIREKLEAEFDAAFGEWVSLLDEIRPRVLESVADPAARRELLDALADWLWLERLRAAGTEAVRAAMREEVRKAAAR
jgi:precorrin-2 dehydrogenase/sirohydrochlorin ferrochelatase